ncbi:MAG TPA: hypothetical protein VGA30_08305 [Actinomycetota bacterium]
MATVAQQFWREALDVRRRVEEQHPRSGRRRQVLVHVRARRRSPR